MAPEAVDSLPRALKWAALALPGIALGLWLAAVALFAHQLTAVGSPPRVARWDGPVEQENLPEAAFLLRDEAWLLRSARLEPVDAESDRDHRWVVVHIDLLRGVAETGWDLLPTLDGRRAEIRGVARRADGGITLLLQHGPEGLRAVSLLRDRGVEDHGAIEIEPQSNTIGVTWDGDRLRAALDDGSALTWREGEPRREIIEGAPRFDEAELSPELTPAVRALRRSMARAALARRQALALARWTVRGWDVLVWEAPDTWRWTLASDAPATAESEERYGAIGRHFPAYEELLPRWPRGLGAPPNPEVSGRSGARGLLRATEDGAWDDAAPAGGFWDWCLPAEDRWVCVSHAPFESTTRIFDGEGEVRTSEVHGRFAPADPVIVESSLGGFWVLDVSHTSAAGRIYYRLNDDLTRADPMSAWERYAHARPETAEEARIWQATSGPSAMRVFDEELRERVFLFLGTVALPAELFGFPLALLLLTLFAVLLRLRRPPEVRAIAVLSVVMFGSAVAVALWMARGYLNLLHYV